MKAKFIVITIFFCLFFSLQTALAEIMFIFNPETRVSEVQQVKLSLKQYLKSKGIEMEVYLFGNTDDFENSIVRLNPDHAIIISYYYQSMKSKLQWRSILAGHYYGEKQFNKLLVSPKSITDLKQLQNKRLAAVSLGSISLSYLDYQLPEGFSSQNIHLVKVSKDIDAIMALGFEQVEGAIVTLDSFEKLKIINSNVYNKLHILQKLASISYPKLVFFPKTNSNEKLILAFKNLPYDGETKIILRFLGITGFIEEGS
ncbi:MAG: hypothetical protein HQK76_07685 [Desulfobacterales bacterium]|nr:hypothetical protein [Desulfobacterales bacterium]